MGETVLQFVTRRAWFGWIAALLFAVAMPLAAQDDPAVPAPASEPAEAAATENAEPEAAPETPSDAPAATVPTTPGAFSIDDFVAFLDAHQAEVDAFNARHKSELDREMMPYLFRFISQMWFFIAILMGIAYFPAVFVVSLLLAPLRANAMNAAIFAGIQTVYLMIMAAVLYAISGASPTVFFGTISVLSLIQLVLLVFTTKGIYDIGILRVLLFGVCGYLVHSLVTGILTGIASVIVPTSVWMGMVATPLADYSQNVVAPLIQTDIDNLQPRYDEAAAKLAAQEKAVAELESQVTASKKAIADAEAAIEAKRQSAAVQYAAIGRLVDKGDLEKARTAYESFAKDHAGDPLAQVAAEQVAAIDLQLKASAEARAQEKQEAQAQASSSADELKAKLKSGKVTLSEVRRAVLGLSREEVRELLGTPTDSATNAYIYRNIKVYDPLRKQNRILIVIFLQGNVQGVNYGN